MNELRIHLDSPEYTLKFRMAPIYRKRATVFAVQITAEGLASGIYADKGVRADGDGYVVDTYVMREKGGRRIPELEASQPVKPGDWLVTNPKALPTDCDNIYGKTDESFRKRYDATAQPGVYTAKGLTRIIPNDNGRAIIAKAYWGEDQCGDVSCHFCAPYDPDHPDDLGEDGRYVLDDSDFRSTYELADLSRH